ncbi:hypothetical protein [Streptomyces albipurpureus]|uniref:Uncharacterized protein n=1 Tax=Streptomyces albipurpureus TaxID=2897419 RepID=A0ABT0UXP2_9ACTN|nr:hypothetical protein [Streptomyces sp. CWNU-1]MCM2393240.1 hypothetical protein [Streptomyces sp. CWNU-1]
MDHQPATAKAIADFATIIVSDSAHRASAWSRPPLEVRGGETEYLIHPIGRGVSPAFAGRLGYSAIPGHPTRAG